MGRERSQEHGLDLWQVWMMYRPQELLLVRGSPAVEVYHRQTSSHRSSQLSNQRLTLLSPQLLEPLNLPPPSPAPAPDSDVEASPTLAAHPSDRTTLLTLSFLRYSPGLTLL